MRKLKAIYVKVPYFATGPNFAPFGLFFTTVHWTMGTSYQLSKR